MVFRLFVLFFVLSLFSCEEKEEQFVQQSEVIINNYETTVKYATLFKIETEGKVKKLTITDPFTEEEAVYSFGKPDETDADHHFISELKNVIVLSSSYLGMMDTLGVLKTVKGIHSLQYVYNPTVRRGINSEQIAQVNAGSSLNLEKVLMIFPDLIITDGSEGTSAKNAEQLREAGIEILSCFDWKEATPLARAEWIKVFGLLFNQEELAANIFNQVEQNYLTAKTSVAEVDTLPQILFSTPYNGVWYIPAGNSYVSQFVKDAKGTHPWIEDPETGSLPLSFERVAAELLNADVWLAPNNSTYETLLATDERFQEFKPFQTRKVFEYNKRVVTGGGNDYWEAGTYRVDLILSDYIQILHPEISNKKELYFFRNLED